MIRVEILSLSISADLRLSPTASQGPMPDGFIMIILFYTFARIFSYISNSAILSSFQWPQENRIICAFSSYWLAPSSKSTAHYSYAILVLNWVLNIYINITLQSYTEAFGWSRVWHAFNSQFVSGPLFLGCFRADSYPSGLLVKHCDTFPTWSWNCISKANGNIQMYTCLNIMMRKTAVIYRSPLLLLQEVHYSVIHKQAGYDFEHALKNQ